MTSRVRISTVKSATANVIAIGLSSNEIAERPHLSPLTAKTHVDRAMTKLDARNWAQLVVIAYQAGLVRPGDLAPPQ